MALTFGNDTIISSLYKEGPHEHQVKRIFPKDGSFIFSGTGPIFKNPLYVLAFTNRCGSNLMADYLRQTGRFAGFNEYLNSETISTSSQQWNCESFPSYFLKLVSHITPQQHRYFGVKASWDQLAMLFRARIPNMFPDLRVIHIWRRDVVAQAVSLLIASQTLKWTSLHESTDDSNPIFDAYKIDKIVQDIRFANDRIALISSALDIRSSSVCYEDLTDDPAKTVHGVANHFGIDLGNWRAKQPLIAKQADEKNEQFIARFRAEVAQAICGRSMDCPSD